MIKIKMVVITLILLLSFNCFAFCPENTIHCRKKLAEFIGGYLQEQYNGWSPAVDVVGNNKDVLIIQSMQATRFLSYKILYVDDLRSVAIKSGFKKIYFIRQIYNEAEFDGNIYDVKKDIYY